MEIISHFTEDTKKWKKLSNYGRVEWCIKSKGSKSIIIMVSKSRPAAASASLSLFLSINEKKLSNTKKKTFSCPQNRNRSIQFFEPNKITFLKRKTNQMKSKQMTSKQKLPSREIRWLILWIGLVTNIC